MPQPVGWGQSTGKVDGAGVLVQFVFTRPAVVSWNDTVPALTTASGGFFRPSVVQASVNASPFCSLTVTFSFVGVGLYSESTHE